MDITCKEFLKILKEAEERGTTLDVLEVGKRLNRAPSRASVIDVFEKCRGEGLVMGSAWGPWLTPKGKHHADE